MAGGGLAMYVAFVLNRPLPNATSLLVCVAVKCGSCPGLLCRCARRGSDLAPVVPTDRFAFE